MARCHICHFLLAKTGHEVNPDTGGRGKASSPEGKSYRIIAKRYMVIVQNLLQNKVELHISSSADLSSNTGMSNTRILNFAVFLQDKYVPNISA